MPDRSQNVLRLGVTKRRSCVSAKNEEPATEFPSIDEDPTWHEKGIMKYDNLSSRDLYGRLRHGCELSFSSKFPITITWKLKRHFLLVSYSNFDRKSQISRKTEYGDQVTITIGAQLTKLIKKKKQGRIYGYQLRTGGQGRKCAYSHFSTRSLRTNGRTDGRTL